MQTFKQKEIEFRAWDINKKKMYHWNDKFFSRIPPVQNMILMQYTGINDKNGKKIFEGDIVLIGKVVHILEIVRYDTKYAGYSSLTSSCLDIEVVGNFFENKELIECVDKCLINNLKEI